MVALIALIVVVAALLLAAWGLRRRSVDDVHSVEGYRHTLDTLEDMRRGTRGTVRMLPPEEVEATTHQDQQPSGDVRILGDQSSLDRSRVPPPNDPPQDPEGVRGPVDHIETRKDREQPQARRASSARVTRWVEQEPSSRVRPESVEQPLEAPSRSGEDPGAHRPDRRLPTRMRPQPAQYRAPDLDQGYPEDAPPVRIGDLDQGYPEDATAQYRAPDLDQGYPEDATAQYRAPDLDQGYPAEASSGQGPSAQAWDSAPYDQDPASANGSPPLVFDDMHPARDAGDALPPDFELASPGRGRVVGRMDQRQRGFLIPAAVAVVVLAVLGGVIAYVVSSRGRPPAASQSTTTSSKAPTTTTVPPALNPLNASPSQATYTVPATYTVNFTVSTGECWVELKSQASGSVLYTGTLTAGHPQSVQASGVTTLNIGAPHELTVSVNQTPVTYPTGYLTPFDMTFQPGS